MNDENKHGTMNFGKETVNISKETTHIPDSTSKYLTNKSNQLISKEIRKEDENKCFEMKKDGKSSSCISLLTMFLSSPSKTCLPEMTNLDLLSDHESTSSQSAPTPPLVLRLTPESGIKFGAPHPKSNIQELVPILSPILQQPCFSHVSQVDPVTDKSSYHVRFTATTQKEACSTVHVSKPLTTKKELSNFTRTKSKELLGGNGPEGELEFSECPSNHSEVPLKPTIKILLENVLPKEKVGLVGEDQDEDELEDDTDEEQLGDEEEDEGQSEDEEIQNGINRIYKIFHHDSNIKSEETNSNHDERSLFEPASYEKMIATSYDPLQKCLTPSIDDINRRVECLSVSSSRCSDFQNDMDLILGDLDEDQTAFSKEDSYIQKSTKEFKVTTPQDIDPTFPYSDTEESNSTESSFCKKQNMLYHHSPPLKMKNNNKKIWSIKSLPEQKKKFYEKQYFKKYLEKKAIHTINIPLNNKNIH